MLNRVSRMPKSKLELAREPGMPRLRGADADLGRARDRTPPSWIVGVAYINPDASHWALRRVRRFLREHARGRWRLGRLDRYPMIEFDDIGDLGGVRRKFGRLIDGYKDLSDCPERPGGQDPEDRQPAHDPEKT